LLEAIAGLLPIESGAVLWRDNALPFDRRRDSIFFLPDGVRPWQEQHVLRVIEFFAAVYGRSGPTLANTIRLLGLSPVLRKRVDALSKGFCRRLMLALALLTPHPLLLMDEPFDGFDLRQTREIMNVLRELALGGRTLLLAIHQLIDAERVCDRFVLLAGGRVRGTGTLDDLRRRTGQVEAGLEDVFLALT
jgi:ABC-type multidrug transport system ATPase subunit